MIDTQKIPTRPWPSIPLAPRYSRRPGPPSTLGGPTPPPPPPTTWSPVRPGPPPGTWRPPGPPGPPGPPSQTLPPRTRSQVWEGLKGLEMCVMILNLLSWPWYIMIDTCFRCALLWCKTLMKFQIYQSLGPRKRCVSPKQVKVEMFAHCGPLQM